MNSPIIAPATAFSSENVQAATVYDFTFFDFGGDTDTLAWDINNSDDVAGTVSPPFGVVGNSFGFLRNGDDGSFTTVSIERSATTTVMGINDSGRSTGGYSPSAGEIISFIRSNTGSLTFFSIGLPPETLGYKINNVGEVAGSYAISGTNIQSFIRHANGSFTLFGAPGATNTIAYGINDTRVTVGVADTSGFIRSATGQFTIFAVPGATITFPFGINRAGEIAGLWVDMTNIGHGFVRDSVGNFSFIDVPGAITTGVFGINDAGHLTGRFADGAGRIHAFIAIPTPPGPSSPGSRPDRRPG